MGKLYKRLVNVYNVFTIKECWQIVYHLFIRKDLPTNHPLLHNLLIFTISCSDTGYDLKIHQGYLVITTAVNESCLRVYLRKFTRDMYVFEQVFILQEYLPVVKKLNSLDKKSDLFIVDAGANIGCATLFLKAYFPNAQIICIEPESSNYEMLLLNIEHNNFKEGTFLHKKALWTSITRLNLHKRDESHDAFHVMEKLLPDKVIGYVETCTLSQIMEMYNRTKLNLLKIDIEGAEKELFEDQACLETFLPNTDILALEVHEEFISRAVIVDILKQYDFRYEQSGEYTIAYNLI